MTTWELIAEEVKGLPAEKQQEVLDFVEFLKARSRQARPFRSLYGLWANRGLDVTPDELAEARREMWGSFPKELP
jgi:hypothetical protein